MRIVEEKGMVVVHPTALFEGTDPSFTDHQRKALFANGFQVDGETFVCKHNSAAVYAAETIKKGGLG